MTDKAMWEDDGQDKT